MSGHAIAWLALLAAQSSGDVSIDRWQGPPWVEIAWHLDTGLDPETQPGLTAAAAEVWRRRAEQEPELAGTVRVSAEHGRILLTAGLPSHRVAEVLPRTSHRLMVPDVADIEAEAALTRAQVNRRQQTLDELALARQAARGALFAETPLSRPPSGTLRGLAAITAGDLSAFFRRNLVRGRFFVRLAGRVDSDPELPSNRIPAGRPAPNVADRRPEPGKRLILVDKPGTRRALIAVGRFPAQPEDVTCRDGILDLDLGRGRRLYYRRVHPEEVPRALTTLLSQAATKDRDCRNDRSAADRSDRRQALRASLQARWTTPDATGGPTTVAVVVTGLKAGLAAELSRQLGISEVVVVPYDLP